MKGYIDKGPHDRTDFRVLEKSARSNPEICRKNEYVLTRGHFYSGPGTKWREHPQNFIFMIFLQLLLLLLLRRAPSAPVAQGPQGGPQGTLRGKPKSQNPQGHIPAPKVPAIMNPTQNHPKRPGCAKSRKSGRRKHG